MENLLKRLKNEQELTNKQLGKIIGRSESTISVWLHRPKKVPIEIQAIISEKLGIEPPKVYESELEDVTVDEVAQRMGRSKNMVRLAIQQGKLPFAIAVKGTGEAYQYWIFRGSFEKFIEENKA